MPHNQLQLTIPTPCHQSWQSMIVGETGRFCHNCQKTVVDFTGLSDQHIVDYLTNAGEHVCGRFVSSQLNRDLIHTPSPLNSSMAQRWLSLIMAGLMSWSTVNAQTDRLPGPTEIVSKPVNQESVVKLINPLITGDSVLVIEGRVVDKTESPLSGVNIVAKGTNKGALTDTAGLFKLTLENDQSDKLVLTISSIGFITQEITMTSMGSQPLVVVLAEDSAMLGEVIQVGYVVKKKTTKLQKLRSHFRTRK